MKVLFAHNDYGGYSGEERFLDLAAKLLVENGHETVWMRKSSEGLRESRLLQAKAFFSGIYSWNSKREIARILDKEQPDVMHAQNLYPFLSPAIMRVAKKRGVPIVMRCPNYRLFCPNGLFLSKGEICERCAVGKEWWCVARNCEENFLKSLGYATRNAAARLSGAIRDSVTTYVVLSDYQRKRFIEFGIPADDVVVLNNALESKALDVPLERGETVGFMGRVSKEKGIELFLEAARALPEIPFAIAGDAVTFPQLEQLAPPNVRVEGFLKGDALEAFCRRMRLLVVPVNWYEAFPNAMALAMSYGKPIIGSDLGAIPEIVDHSVTGYLAPPNDVDKFVKRIKEIYNDPEKCMEMGTAGRSRVKEKFNLDIFYSKLIQIYTAAIEKHEATAK